MTILELLQEDHTKLRQELVSIRQNLDEPRIRDRIKHFISDYELHENIEDKMIFPLLEKIIEKTPQNFRDQHDHIWTLLDQLIEALDTMRFPEFQRAYFKFVAALETHMGVEERVLFPMIENQAEPKDLEELGRAAKSRLEHFSSR